MAETMRALVYQGPGVLKTEERAIPEPKKGEVQIRVKRVSICGSDLGAYKYASDRFAPPLVLGHEFSGDITKVGEGVEGLRAGQRVTVNPMVFCNECDFCRRGEGNLCGNRRSMGTAIGGVQTDGAMREYVTVRDWMVVPVADCVSYEAAALLEPCGVALACAKKGHRQEETCVVVFGAGPIGLLTVKFLKVLGVETVVVSDILDRRLEKAKACGADYVINPKNADVVSEVKRLTDGYGADRAVNAAGEFLINQSFAVIKNGGISVLVALTHAKVEIDPMEIVGRGLQFMGSYMFTTEMGEAAQMLAEGRLVVDDLVTSVYPLEHGKAAFDVLSKPDNDEIKVQIILE